MIFDLENENWKNSEVTTEMVRLLSLAAEQSADMVVEAEVDTFQPSSEEEIVSLAAEIKSEVDMANLSPIISGLVEHLEKLLVVETLTESQRFKIDSAIAELTELVAK